MGNIAPLAIAVLSGFIGLAIVSVVVSRNAQTPSVLSAGGSALAQVIGAAVSPVSSAQSNNFGAASMAALGTIA